MKIKSDFVKTNQSMANKFKISGDDNGEVIDKFLPVKYKPLDLIPKNFIDSAMGSAEKENWQKDQRPAEFLKTTEDGRIHMKNVRCGFKEAADDKDWDPLFKEVSVDPNKVKDVYIVIEPFAPEWIAGHALSYFEFEDDGKVKTSDGQEKNGLVLSIEARLKEGDTYSLIDGMKDKFLNVYQLGTWDDTVQKCSRRRGHKLIRYKLDLSKEEKKKLLEKTLDESFKDRGSDYYNTLRNSCYSNQVRIINSILPKERRINEWLLPQMLKNPGTILPKAAGFTLGSKGIITDAPPVITNPNKEMYPGGQVKTSFIGEALKIASDARAWEFMSGLTGMAIGTALGSLVLPPIVAIPTTGLIGTIVGLKTGDYIKRESHAIVEESEKYFKESPLENIEPSVTLNPKD